jgi:ferredoxin, 2Fe-2S
MRAAVDNSVPGIDGDCGGQCAGGTCHVYVDSAWQEKTGARTEAEVEMLDFAAGTQENSRLACQITLTSALDGCKRRSNNPSVRQPNRSAAPE